MDLFRASDDPTGLVPHVDYSRMVTDQLRREGEKEVHHLRWRKIYIGLLRVAEMVETRLDILEESVNGFLSQITNQNEEIRNRKPAEEN